MKQKHLCDIIQDQTNRALWEVGNVIEAIPGQLWHQTYCEMPMWKHVYHTLHSLDLWFINPRDKQFCEPEIHEENLNNLDVLPGKCLTRKEITDYCEAISQKIASYLITLTDEELLTFPADCEYTKFTLILAQFRHLHTHLGIIMGFIIDDTGLWPRVVGLENPIPGGEYSKYC